MPLAGLLIGFLLPHLAEAARAAVPACMLSLTFASIFTVSWRDLRDEAARASSWIAVIWLLAAPAALTLAASHLLAPGTLAGSALLCALAPPGGAVTGLARILGLRPQLALFASVVLTILAPLTYPASVALLAAASDGVPGMMLVRLLATVAGSILLASLLRRRLAGLIAAAPLAAPGLAMTCGAVLVLASAPSVSIILAHPAAMAPVAALAFGLNLVIALVSAAAFCPLGWRTAATVGLASGNRSVGFAWTASGLDLSATANAFFALSLLATVVVPIALQIAGRGVGWCRVAHIWLQERKARSLVFHIPTQHVAKLRAGTAAS